MKGKIGEHGTRAEIGRMWVWTEEKYNATSVRNYSCFCFEEVPSVYFFKFLFRFQFLDFQKIVMDKVLKNHERIRELQRKDMERVKRILGFWGSDSLSASPHVGSAPSSSTIYLETGIFLRSNIILYVTGESLKNWCAKSKGITVINFYYEVFN